jgi:hypothetical protein
MDFFYDLSKSTQGRKRARNDFFQKRQKIRIVRSKSLTTTRFFFPGSDEKLKTLETFKGDPEISIQEAQSRMSLLEDTIIYASHKIRKLDPLSSLVEEKGEKRKSDLRKDLRPDQPIFSSQVDFYVKLVPFPKCMICALSSLYKVISNYFYAEASLKDYQLALQQSKLTSLLDFSFVLLPVKEIGWSLILINNEAKTLEFYSSHPEEDYRIPCERVEKTLKELEKAEGYDWEIMKVAEHANIIDSGVFLLSFIRDLALNQPFSISQESVGLVREKMSVEMQGVNLIG